MKYDVYGAWALPRKNGIIDSSNDAKKKFWEEVDSWNEGLSSACGCYVFVLQNKPWYVGMASKQSFSRECFAHQKINIYNTALREYSKAVPYLYLIARKTPNSNNFCLPGKNGHQDIEFLEKMLIGLGISRNPNLSNIKGTKLLKELNVPGIINTKKGQGSSKAVQEIKSVLGI